MNNKKKIIITIICILAIVIISSITIFIRNEKEKSNKLEQIKEYKADAKKFNSDVFYSLLDLEIVGNKIKDYWHDYIYSKKYDSIDDAVEKALEDSSKVVNEIKSKKSNIDSKYRNLLKLPIESDAELNEIKNAIKKLYDEYYVFYDIVITPSGSYNTFTNDFGDVDSSSVKAYSYLKLLLEEEL